MNMHKYYTKGAATNQKPETTRQQTIECISIVTLEVEVENRKSTWIDLLAFHPLARRVVGGYGMFAF